ncbi:MAG: ATP-binding protein, partial [Bacteroidota bacterium]
GSFKNYYVQDGLQSNEFNLGAYHKSRSGEMFFGGINGFNSFYPDSIKDNPHIPPLVITGFQIFNESVKISPQGETPLQKHISVTDEIVLSHKDNVFSFEFAALDYNAPEKNQNAYMMEGFDEDWIYSGTRRFATYTNLDPGEYVFRVRGSNNDGIWNEEGTSVRIIITPPWWQTWWAYTVYVILIVAVLYGIRRFEVNRERLAHDLKLQRFEAEKLREFDQMKSRFFANISHEFRTPLTLILGPLKKLTSGDSQGDAKEQFRMMLRNGQRLLRLINQLLDFSKLEAGRMSLQARPENIVRLLKSIVSQFASLAERERITLRFVAPHQMITVYLDRDKLEKIMYNLLSNAVKFTPKGGKVSVSVDRSPLTKVTKGGKEGEVEFVEITVADTGIGIPPDCIDKIFDRFYQVDSTHRREPAPLDKSSPTERALFDKAYPTGQEGTGIGLALTKELVELHSGEIHVCSQPGRGSTFIVRLPLGKEQLKKAEIAAETPEAEVVKDSVDYDLIPIEEYETPDAESYHTKEEETPSDDRAPIVLVVEDSHDMRGFIREILGKAYRVREAGDGVEGFERAVEIIPDLIISDVMMPRMDGFELCHKLKTDERTSHIPVILLTARASGESKVKGLETGADDYLTKPFDARELQIRVKNLIEERRKLRERFSREVTLQPRDIAVSSMDEQFLKRVMDVIEQRMSDPDFSTDTFTKKVGMSRMQLHRKLRALTDHSTGEFIRTMRLKRAAQLLKQHSGTVSEIAYEVGFNNLSYFARCFRDLFGQLPSDYASE